jgi:cytochrome P450
LRVHTSNSPPIERVVPSGGLQVDEYFIKEGTVLAIPQFLAHRDEMVFGADAELFRPERWLEADAAAVKAMDQNFMTVSIASRRT